MQRLAALQAASAAPVVPVEKQQEILLSHIRARAGNDKSLAFTEGGVPVVACVLYKSLLHWKTMQAERTNTFDRIIELFQNSSHSSDSILNLSYWLTNHCTLYYLVEVHLTPTSRPLLFCGGSPRTHHGIHISTISIRCLWPTHQCAFYSPV